MGIEKTYLLVRESVYWVSMNANIEQTMQHCSTGLEYQSTQLHEAALHYDIPSKSCEVVGAYVFMIHNKNLISL